MNVREIPSVVVDHYLSLIRVPLDGAIRLLPGNGTGAKPTANLVLDRADATVRTILAAALGDSILRGDARRRHEAAEVREQALRIRVNAERKANEADVRLEERRQQADRQREHADRLAKDKRAEAARKRRAESQTAAKTERQRRVASRKTAARAAAAVNGQAPEQRLEALMAKTDALSQKEKELIARDEARRLRQATRRAKAERKDR